MFGKKQETTSQAVTTTKAVQKEEIIPLKAICVELKLDPREAREILRIAARDAKKYPELARSRKPGALWEWKKNSPVINEVRAALTV